MKSLKRSLAKKAYWANVTPEQRSARLSSQLKKGWSKKTPEEREAWGKRLTEARLKKLSTTHATQDTPSHVS